MMDATAKVAVGGSRAMPDTTPAAIFVKQNTNADKAAQLCESLDNMERALFDHGSPPSQPAEPALTPTGMFHQILHNEGDIESRLDYANSLVNDLLARLNH